MAEKNSDTKEWRHFYLSDASRIREKELLEKYGVKNMLELIGIMETKTRCYAELLKRIEPSSPLSESCIAQFAVDFQWVADICLGLQECVYGNGLEYFSPAIRDEEGH